MDLSALARQLRTEAPALDLIAARDFPPRRLHDWALDGAACPALLARPRSVDEVAALMRACSRHRVPVVPQGGMTGLAGGGVPTDDACIVVSMELFSGIEELDRDSSAMTVRAGTPLQTIQEAADAAGLLFPLDLGARGSCQIGGNVSTNAGGNRVIRYGMTRELVLGLEAVLPDGTVLSSLGKMLKNNTGPDWKHLFIGAEGTFGIVTRVVLRLFPRPAGTSTAFCAIPGGYHGVLALLERARRVIGPTLSAFEVMWPDFYRFATTRVPGNAAPLAEGASAYALIEADGTDAGAERSRMEVLLQEALEAEVITDAVIAESEARRAKLWRIRDASGELRPVWGPHAVFDVSAAVSRLGALVDTLYARLHARWPDADTAIWGHVGDGNIHICVRAGDGVEFEREIESIVYDATRAHHGSISAEHGIGLLKRDWLGYSRSPAELGLLRALKHAIDPHNLMNPGKIIR